MVKHGDRAVVRGIDAVEYLGSGLFPVQAMQIVAGVLQQFHQVGRRAGLEPIAAHLLLVQRIEQAERIVNAFGVGGEMITVVIGLQPGAHRVVLHSLRRGKRTDTRPEISVKLRFGNAAKIEEPFIHRDVFQVVQVAEYTHFAELGNAGEQGKLNVAVPRFEHAVEGFQRQAVGVLQLFVADRLQHRLVILIHENRYPLSGLLMGTPDDTIETEGKGRFTFTRTINCLPVEQSLVEDGFQFPGCVILPDIQIEVQHGIDGPLLLQFLHRQTVEQLALPPEISFEGRHQQAFTETARAAEEIVGTRTNQAVDQCRFIYIEIPVFAKTLKVLNPDGIKYFIHNRFSYPMD